MNSKLTKCDFCKFSTVSGCTANNSSACKQASYEYNQWLKEQKQKNNKDRGNKRNKYYD